MIRCAARSRGSPRETIRLRENIDEIWVFSESAALTAASSDVALRRASDREQRGRRCVKHVKRLLKKNLARAARKRACNVESGANRANRSQVIRGNGRRATADGRPTTESN